MSAARLFLPCTLLVLLIVPVTGIAQSKCPDNNVDTNLPTPTIAVTNPDMTAISGRIAKGAVGTVQVCIDGTLASSPPKVAPDGSFTVNVPKLYKGQTIVAQFIPSGGGTSFGNPSAAVLVGGAIPDESTTWIFIGGVEQASYSSLSQNSNAFVNVSIQGPDHWISGWGRVRLLSAPQPSTQGIVST